MKKPSFQFTRHLHNINPVITVEDRYKITTSISSWTKLALRTVNCNMPHRGQWSFILRSIKVQNMVFHTSLSHLILYIFTISQAISHRRHHMVCLCMYYRDFVGRSKTLMTKLRNQFYSGIYWVGHLDNLLGHNNQKYRSLTFQLQR